METNGDAKSAILNKKSQNGRKNANFVLCEESLISWRVSDFRKAPNNKNT